MPAAVGGGRSAAAAASSPRASPIKPVVTEDHGHQLRCPVGGAVTRAVWPQGVPTGAYAPRVQAIAALWTGAYRLSKRTTQRVLEDLFGLPMSLGTISTLAAATAQAVAAPVAEARALSKR